MKVTRKAEIINLNQIVDVSVDVHKDNLCFFFEIKGSEFSDVCRNRTKVIEKRLLKLAKPGPSTSPFFQTAGHTGFGSASHHTFFRIKTKRL